MKQVKKSGFFQRACVFVLCLSFVLASIVTDPLTAHANTADYINRCAKSMKEPLTAVSLIGYAYLVGTDDIAAASWTTKRVGHDIYAVNPDTKIQGKTFDAKYFPQGYKRWFLSL